MSLWDTLWNRAENRLIAAGPSYRSKMRRLFQLIHRYGLRGPMLDIACGTGELLAALPKNLDLAGTDASQRALDIAVKNCPHATLHLLNIEEASLPEKFRTIFCTNALEEMKDDDVAMRNMARMLAQDGRLFIVTTHRKAYWTRKDEEASNVRRYERSDITSLLSQAGLKPVHIESWGWPLYRVWYRLMASVNQDTLWEKRSLSLPARVASRIAYYALYVDDLFIGLNRGSILFIIAEHAHHETDIKK